MNILERITWILHPKEKVLRTIWSAEKGGKFNFLVGTAHFFPYTSGFPSKDFFEKQKGLFSKGHWILPVWPK